MGILFSRPGHADNSLPSGTFNAGNLSSLNSSDIAPYIGINTGLYHNISTTDLPPVPYEWMVSPSSINSSTQCPSPNKILTLFAVSEAIITLATPLLAYRPLIYRLSGGYLGRRRKSSLYLTWSIVFVCQLLANAIIAGMIGNTHDYGGLNMLHVFTVFMARPRFHFVVLGLLRSLVGVKRGRDLDRTGIVRKQVDNRVEFPYADAYIASIVAELLVLVISALFTGVTWHRLPLASKPRAYMDELVSYVESAPGVLLLCMVAFVPVYRRYGHSFPLEGRRYETGRQWGVSVAADGTATVGVRTQKKRTHAKQAVSAVVAAILMAYVVLVQWSYWSRFLTMPGVLFCPPKLIQTGVIWTLFSFVGIIAGAAS